MIRGARRAADQEGAGRREGLARSAGVLRWVGTVLVVAAVAVALARARPPGLRTQETGTGTFSFARALAHVERIASSPHPSGSEAQAEVREYLTSRIRALGLEPEALSVAGSPLVNLSVRIPGARPTGTVLLVAHYDSVPAGPGAADDGVAVAAVLETLRDVLATGLRNDLRVLLTDGEEEGLLGARAFTGVPGALADVRAVLNFEARGNAGRLLMFETGERSAALVSAYAEVAPRPSADSMMAAVYRRMPNDTDFTVFRRAGLPGLNFAFIEGYTAYHSRFDTPENVSRESLQQVGDTMLAVVRRLGDADLGALPPADAVYFDVLGAFLARYPLGLAVPLALVGALLALAAVVLGIRRGVLRPRGVLAGVGVSLGVVLLAGLLSVALSQGVLRLFPERAGPVLGTPGDPWFFVAMTLAAAALRLAVPRRLSPRAGTADLAAGGLALWCLLLLVVSALLPEASFFLQWPLVAGTVALAARVLARGPTAAAAVVAALAAVPTVVLLAPRVQGLFVATALVGSVVPVAIVALVLGTLLLALEPLMAVPRAALALGLGAVAAVGAGLANV